jgi:CheY-like chemotaxis protein
MITGYLLPESWFSAPPSPALSEFAELRGSQEVYSMQTSDLVLAQLPFLRRYARALSGSQPIGDMAVKAVLDDILAGKATLDDSRGDRLAVFKAFHARWPDIPVAQDTTGAQQSGFETADALKQHLTVMAPPQRQAFLLAALEEFRTEQIAEILGLAAQQAGDLIREGARDAGQIDTERVLIIEDEMLIALDLKQMVEDLGHSVVEIVHNHTDAVRAASEHRPGLILADVNLARGSSGIDAVAEILEAFAVPVIFVTAFPERLLTGEQIEPAFLVTKPFQPESIRAALSQALACRVSPEVV